MARNLFTELKRRNVYKAALSYIALAWLIMQACAILFPLFAIADGYQKSVFVALLLLFPLWIAFSWIYEYTSQGFVKTEELPEDSNVFRQTDRRLNVAIIGILSAAVLLLLADRFWGLTTRIAGSTALSIAVLPFDNLSGDEQQAYYALGMQDELRGQLTQLENLRVISRTSTMRYQTNRPSLTQIADELKVDLIVEGSLMKYEDSVRIQVHLIRSGKEEDHLLSRQYDRPVRHVLDMHKEVTRDIANGIKLVLTPTEEAHLSETRVVDPKAYDALVRGRFHIFQFTPQDIQLGMQYFYSALAIDPELPEAYASISATAAFMLVLGALPPKEAGKMMMDNALRSLELDPDLAFGYTSLASAETWSSWDWEAAEEAWTKAISLDPSDATAQIYYSHYLACMGRFEAAKRHGMYALDLDPFNAFFYGLYGVTLMLCGETEQAYNQLQKAMEMDPLNPFPLYPMTGIQRKRGEVETAFEMFLRYNQALGDTAMVQAMVTGKRSGGLSAGYVAAAEVLKERRNYVYVRPHLLVLAYDLAGETDLALDWLDSSYVYRDHDMTYTQFAPYSGELRAHPRFTALLGKMNFPSLKD